MKRVISILSVTGAAVLLGACGSVNVDDYLPDQTVEYKREAQAEANLEVPPDLTSARINDRMAIPDGGGAGANYSEFMADRRARGVDGAQRVGTSVLPDNAKVDIKRDGDRRWLVVEGNPDAVWDRVLAFWQDQGVLLEEQNPDLGIMRTSWLDNRATIARDFITDNIRKVLDGLYETGLRDQYRVRFEKQDATHTEVYLTHYGLEEIAQSDGAGDNENTLWTKRPRDPELEAEMLNRLMVFLGISEDRAQAQLRARGNRGPAISQLVQGREGTKLIIGDEFNRAWRLVGLSLDRVGFAVEDRDRTKGLYYVRYNDPAAEEEGGLLSSLKFWGDDKPDGATEYQIKVAVDGDKSVVTVLDSVGNPDQTDTAKRILKLVQEQIR